MSETSHDEITSEVNPYVSVEVKGWKRFIYASLVIVIGLPIFFVFLDDHFKKGTLLPFGWLWVLPLWATIWLARMIWNSKLRKDFSTIEVPVNEEKKKRFLVIAFMGYLCGLGLACVEFLKQTPSMWQFICYVLVATSLFALVFGKLVSWKFERQLTKAAIQEKTRLELTSREKTRIGLYSDYVEGVFNRVWWVRYGVGLVLFYFAYVFLTGEPAGKNSQISGVLLAIIGLYCTKEVIGKLIVFVVICGIGYAIFGALAALPLSVAVIIGAVIIANSNKSN